MTHKCKECGKSAPDVKFAKQHCSNTLRTKCNKCRSAQDRATPPETEPRNSGSVWESLCADCRPDWGWNNRYIPKNHDKGQEFQI